MGSAPRGIASGEVTLGSSSDDGERGTERLGPPSRPGHDDVGREALPDAAWVAARAVQLADLGPAVESTPPALELGGFAVEVTFPVAPRRAARIDE